MPFEPMIFHSWYPASDGGETRQQRERRITQQWMREHLPAPIQQDWLRTLNNSSTEVSDLLTRICKQDTAEMVALLYPRSPQLFRTARKYTLSPDLFSCLWEHPPYSEEVLTQCYHARTAHLSAACLFALTGAVSSLEALLEQGADPDGLETPDSWSYIELPDTHILPVTPLDCAILSDNEDCQLALELYGGKGLHDHLATGGIYQI